MFAKLRPGGHRRSGSTPTSPSPNQIPAGFLPLPPNSSHGPTSPSSIEDFLHGFRSPDSQTSTAGVPPPSHPPQPPQSASQQQPPSESPVSPDPPYLPPIPRIASVYERPDEQGRPQGLGLQAAELQRMRTTESLESKSSGSPILGEQMFSPARMVQEQPGGVRRPGTAGEIGQQYRAHPQGGPAPPRKEGVSEFEFRSILQGKHLPPLPNSANAPRRAHEVVSPPPMPLGEDAHQIYARTPTMALGNQSRQSLVSTATRNTDRTGKTKTRLLNPMSLLLRRRNGQMLDHLSEESLVTHRNAGIISPSLPDDYDPSIRGHVVHDFSAPRPRRNFSSQSMADLAERERREATAASRDSGRDPASRKMSDDSRQQQQHTPVFREHFEDDVDQERKDSALRAENLANSDFVKRNSFQPLDGTHENLALPPTTLPPFARGNQKTVYKPLDQQQQTSISSPPPPPVPAKDADEEQHSLAPPQRPIMPLSPLMEDPISPTSDTDATPKRTSARSTIRQSSATLRSQRSPPSARSSRISRMSSSASANGLPAHMFSRASRFSFQYANTDSAAQERMLEEKHREKAAKAQAERKHESFGEEDEFDEDMDFEDLEGLDEDVPMNGEEWDYGGRGLGIGNMTLDDMGAGAGGEGLGGMDVGDFEEGDQDGFGFGGGGLGNMTLDDMPGGGGGLGNMTLDDMPGGGGGLGNMTLDDMPGGGGGLGNMTLDDMPGGGGGLGNMTLDDMPGGGGGLGNMTLDDMPGGGGGLGNMTLDDMPGGGGGLGNMTLDDMPGGGGGLRNMTLDDMPSGLGSMTLNDMPGGSSGGGGLGNMTLNDMPSSVSSGTLNNSTSGSGSGKGYPTLKSMSSVTRKPLSTNPLRGNPIAAVETAVKPVTSSQNSGRDSLRESGEKVTPDPAAAAPSTTNEHRKSANVDSVIEQDDFYFDNGEFADEDLINEINAETDTFDESVFDDPTHPLYERRQPTQAPPIPRMSSKRIHNTMRGRKPRSRPASDPVPEHPDPGAPIDMVTAYHSALAMAANKAAASGRFDRANSIGSNESQSPIAYHGGPVQMGLDKLSPTQPELTPDVARLSQESSTLSPPTARASGGDELNTLSKSVGFMLPGAGAYDDSYASDFDYSDYDSTFEDDPMIAAANAEALENDDEGLYGSEFGFYARPGTTDSTENGGSESVYGGYFGPKNWGEIKRQRSTREPNLTPITERSEYSTRNSFIGLGFAEHERGAAAASSPGLAALARMSPGWEGDMSMDALLKLRRGAWGGSQGSVDKSSPRQGSSPMNSSPVVSKGAAQQPPVWSSPMSRTMTMPEEDEEEAPDADDEFDEGMLDEANYDEDEEEYEDDGEEQEWDQGAGEDGVSPLEESPPSESPTIRAQAPQSQQAPAGSSSVSPIGLGPPFTFPANTVYPQQASLATTASTSPLPTGPGTSTHSQRSSASLSLALPNSPLSPATADHKRGHSRSGSDSVTYVRERDAEKGEFRWVLERRRTGEDGGEFLVERTTVEGGRI